jgi:hypothetical protein
MAVLAVPPFLQFEDANGAPLAGGMIYTYAAGTTTPKATFTDSSGLVQATNPVVLDAAGRTTIWIDGSYKFVVRDANGVEIETTDNVSSFTSATSASNSYFQSFSGNGSQTTFTLSQDLGTDENTILVFVNNAASVTNIPKYEALNNTANQTVFTTVNAYGSDPNAIQVFEATSAGIFGRVLRPGTDYNISTTTGGTTSTLTLTTGSSTVYTPFLLIFENPNLGDTSSGVGFQVQNPSNYTLSNISLTFAVAPKTGTNNILVFAPSLYVGAAAVYAAAADSSATTAANSANVATTAAQTAASYVGTLIDASTTSNAVGTGTKTFTVSANKGFSRGQPIVIVDAASNANYMLGQVVAYSGTTLTTSITQVGGSGTKTSWNLSATGGFIQPHYPPALSVVDYGGSPSSTGAANATAFTNWFAALMAAPVGTAGYIPPGTYNIASGLTWDFVTRANTGVTIYGAGQDQTILNFTNTTGDCLLMKASGGTSPANLVGWYYNVFRDFAVMASTTGVACKIGQDNGSDSVQGSDFRNLIFINNNPSATSALRINGATQNVFYNVQANCAPATSVYAGAGNGCELVMAAFNSFIACTFGNGNVGLLIHANGDTVNLGFSYSNVFLNLDIENVQTCLKQTSPNASRNRFICGEWYTQLAGGFAVSCSASGLTSSGASLILEDVNLPNNQLYGSPLVSPALDPANQVGVIFVGGGYGLVTTPNFPGSGSTYTNTTGQSQFVTWGGGTITAVNTNGLSRPATINSAMLEPGDTISFTYTGTPSWYFRNAVN